MISIEWFICPVVLVFMSWVILMVYCSEKMKKCPCCNLFMTPQAKFTIQCTEHGFVAIGKTKREAIKKWNDAVSE